MTHSGHSVSPMEFAKLLRKRLVVVGDMTLEDSLL